MGWLKRLRRWARREPRVTPQDRLLAVLLGMARKGDVRRNVFLGVPLFREWSRELEVTPQTSWDGFEYFEVHMPFGKVTMWVEPWLGTWFIPSPGQWRR